MASATIAPSASSSSMRHVRRRPRCATERRAPGTPAPARADALSRRRHLRGIHRAASRRSTRRSRVGAAQDAAGQRAITRRVIGGWIRARGGASARHASGRREAADPEGRALAGGAGREVDPALVPLDDHEHGREAEAGALALGLRREEGLEDRGLDRLRDARGRCRRPRSRPRRPRAAVATCSGRRPPSMAWTAFTTRLMRAISSWLDTPLTGGQVRPPAPSRAARRPSGSGSGTAPGCAR